MVLTFFILYPKTTGSCIKDNIDVAKHFLWHKIRIDSYCLMEELITNGSMFDFHDIYVAQGEFSSVQC